MAAFTPPYLIEHLVRLEISLRRDGGDWLDDELSDALILAESVVGLIVAIRRARLARPGE